MLIFTFDFHAHVQSQQYVFQNVRSWAHVYALSWKYDFTRRSSLAGVLSTRRTWFIQHSIS